MHGHWKYSYRWHFTSFYLRYFIFSGWHSTLALKIMILRTQWTMYCYGCSQGNEFSAYYSVSGMNGPGNERSRERKFQGTNGPGNECSRERMVPRTKVPSWERMFQGTDSLGNEYSSIHYFATAGLRAWNKLPSHLRLMQSTDTFRRYLKTFLFHQAFLSRHC